MKSFTTDKFRSLFAKLPKSIKQRARESYRLFKNNPHHPSLHFKTVHLTEPIYSVRISKDYRAVGIINDEKIFWFWIGPHSEYDQLLKNYQKN